MVAGSAPLLAADGIVRRYGARTVLDVDHIDVRRGEILAIAGPNGAGKSTLFRTLLLIERPDAGSVCIDGAVMRPHDPRARGRLTGVFQRPVLFTGTVESNISFGLRAAGVARHDQRRRVAEVMRSLEIDSIANESVHRLSGGETQRVALARALVVEPDVLLLDEPTASLDVSVRRRFREDIERVARQRAGSVILITHDAAEAFGLADRIAVMQDGRFVQTGSPDEIVLRPGTPFVAELTGAELLLHGVVDAHEDGLAAVRITPDVVVWATVRRGDEMARGAKAVVAYRPEDVVLAPVADTETSAVNRIQGTVEAIVPAGALVRVRVRAAHDIALTALLTRRSVEALGLGPGANAVAQIKAAALHAWARGTY